MEMIQVKQKALELKQTIEAALKKFREETGYTPQIDIETRSKQTNSGNFISQSVTVTLTVS